MAEGQIRFVLADRSFVDQPCRPRALWHHSTTRSSVKSKLASFSLMVDAVFKNHIDEIRSDPAFVEEIILAHCLTASPSELRKMAVQDREKGKLKFAYYLEVIADQRGRGEFT